MGGTTEKIQIMQRYDFRSRTRNDTTEDIKKPEGNKQSNRGKQRIKQRKTHNIRGRQSATVPNQSPGATTNTAERHKEVIKLENGTESLHANVFRTRLTEKDESSPQQASNYNIGFNLGHIMYHVRFDMTFIVVLTKKYSLPIL